MELLMPSIHETDQGLGEMLDIFGRLNARAHIYIICQLQTMHIETESQTALGGKILQ